MNTLIVILPDNAGDFAFSCSRVEFKDGSRVGLVFAWEADKIPPAHRAACIQCKPSLYTVWGILTGRETLQDGLSELKKRNKENAVIMPGHAGGS